MTDRFEMSMMEVFTFFFGFQIKQAKEGAFISQMKYTRDVLKKFGMDKVMPMKTPMGRIGNIPPIYGTASLKKINRLCALTFCFISANTNSATNAPLRPAPDVSYLDVLRLEVLRPELLGP
jgi:hypothetical protein